MRVVLYLILLVSLLTALKANPEHVALLRLKSTEWIKEESLLACRYSFTKVGENIRYTVVSGVKWRENGPLDWVADSDCTRYEIWNGKEWMKTKELGAQWCGTGLETSHFIADTVSISVLIGDRKAVKKELKQLGIKGTRFALRIGINADLIMEDDTVNKITVHSDPCIFELGKQITVDNDINGSFRFWDANQQSEYLNDKLSKNKLEPDRGHNSGSSAPSAVTP